LRLIKSRVKTEVDEFNTIFDDMNTSYVMESTATGNILTVETRDRAVINYLKGIGFVEV